MRFKIRTIMLVIAAAALLLLAMRDETLFAVLIVGGLLTSCLAMARGLWQSARPFQRVSALGFAVAASSMNATALVSSVAFSLFPRIAILVLLCVFAMPITFGFGAAWSTPPGRTRAITCQAVLRWATTLALSLAPITMLLTPWPFRLAFLASQPSLERLADRVGAGNPVTTPEWAGVFRIVGSDRNTVTGAVGLITDPNASGRSGFERRGPAPPGNGPFYNLSYDLKLTGKWRYVEED